MAWPTPTPGCSHLLRDTAQKHSQRPAHGCPKAKCPFEKCKSDHVLAFKTCPWCDSRLLRLALQALADPSCSLHTMLYSPPLPSCLCPPCVQTLHSGSSNCICSMHGSASHACFGSTGLCHLESQSTCCRGPLLSTLPHPPH